MRRFLYTLIAGAAIAALIPATALAQGRHHRDFARHHHHHHHARIHHRGFGRPSAPAQQNVGTVASFDGTTLAITLNNGSTVTGTVTSDTEIRCEGSDQGSFHRDDDNNMGDCSMSLQAGAAVHDAVLRLTPDGAVWQEVELAITPSSSSPTTPSQG